VNFNLTPIFRNIKILQDGIQDIKKTFVELPATISLLWKQKLYRLVQSVDPPHIPISFCVEPENCNIADANVSNDIKVLLRKLVMANFSIEYKLPYKIKPLLKPYDAKSYAFGCIYQFFGKTVVLSGYVGTDCLLACTGFHLTGYIKV
ncbi:odorant receptor 13a-like isoform X2, partial [Vespula squamosa]